MKSFLLLVFALFALTLCSQNQLIDINANPYNEGNIVTNNSLEASSFLYKYKKARPFTLNQSINALSSNTEVQNIAILLDLFTDNQFTANVSSIKRDVNNTLVITAKIEGSQMGFCILTADNEGRAYIRIELPENNQSFNTLYNPETGELYLGEIDNERLPDSGCDVLEIPQTDTPPHINNESQNGEVKQNEQTLDRGVNDIAEIDIMVVYTPAAENYAIANHGGMSNVIASMMATNQTVFNNSLAGVNINLVYSQLINYTETGNSQTDLIRLQNREDGFMDEVHQWRVDSSADLVALITTNQDVGGLAYLLNNIEGSPNYGFNLLTIPSIVYGPYTAVHEIGHNMGCGHHKLQNTQPGPGVFDYSAGWRWTSTNNGKYCSVMTYSNGSYFPDGITHSRVPYFSDPNINYIGTPTGHTVNGDNARTIRETKHVIAAYSENLVGCSGGVHWPTTIYTPTASVQTIPSYSVYYTIHNVVEGTVYYWSFCTNDGGNAPFDSQITLRRNDDTSFLSFNDDFCGDDAKIKWTATFTGQVRVLVNESYCQYYTGVQATLAFGIDTSNIIYEVTTTANPLEAGTTTGNGNYGFEEPVTVLAVANPGYHFTNWTENGAVVSTAASYSFIAENDRDLIANFELNTYTIATQPNPENGGIITGGGVYDYGDTCTLSATENTGYTFINWIENGTVVSTDSNYSFTVESGRSLIANFDANPYEITATAIPAGGGNIVGDGQYLFNEQCTLIATSSSGYGFINWTENGAVVATNSNYSFTVIGDRSLEANFAEVTLIPDPNFEQALIDLGIDSDTTINGRVFTADIESITSLNVADKNISDLTGINDFSSLTSLDCENNNLNSLNLLQNTALQLLFCSDNTISNLIIPPATGGTGLRVLSCSNNQLSTLPINDQLELISISCDRNLLSELNVTALSNLEALQCFENNISTLDISNNNLLEFLSISSNPIAFIDLTNNINLKTFYLNNGQFTTLDISNNPLLEELMCHDNQINNLDLSDKINLRRLIANNNELSLLNIKNGNNQIIVDFNVQNNPNLICVEVDDEDAANNGTGVYANWMKDQTTTYSEDCALGVDNINRIVFSIYPNPAKNSFSITSTSTIETVSIYDVFGKLIKSFVAQNEYEVSGLSKGLYLIIIHNKMGSSVEKLIIE